MNKVVASADEAVKDVQDGATIMVSGFETHNTTVELLVVFAALNSVLSLGYYAPLVNRMYRHEPSAAVRQGRPIGLLMGTPLMVLTAAVIVIGFWPGIVEKCQSSEAVSLPCSSCATTFQ